MSLDKLETAISEYLALRLDPPMKSIGGGVPDNVADVPAIAISMSDVVVGAAGVGKNAMSVVTGALPMTTDIDLNDPVLRFADETVTILSMDRQEVTVPHGALVTQSGDNIVALSGDDISVTVDAAALSLVTDSPGSGEFAVQRLPAVIQVGEPLPLEGILRLEYYIGRWETESIQMSGTISLDLYAKLVQGVEEATKKIYGLLSAHSVEGLRRISPVGMSTIGIPDRLEGNTRMRRLSFEFAYEYTLVHVPTGGGVISTIAVTSSLRDNEGIEQENIQ